MQDRGGGAQALSYPRPLPAARPLPQDEYASEPGSVISADFYHSNALMPLSDEQIVQRVVSHLQTCEPGFKGEAGGVEQCATLTARGIQPAYGMTAARRNGPAHTCQTNSQGPPDCVLD